MVGSRYSAVEAGEGQGQNLGEDLGEKQRMLLDLIGAEEEEQRAAAV
jgi:hypothetical protein